MRHRARAAGSGRVGVVCVAAGLAAVGLARPAAGQTVLAVTTGSDSGPGSLRAALTTVDGSPSTSFVVNLSPNIGPITLSGAEFPVGGVRPSRDMATAGFALTVRAGPNAVVYASYDAILPTGNTADQTLSAGLRLRF